MNIPCSRCPAIITSRSYPLKGAVCFTCREKRKREVSKARWQRIHGKHNPWVTVLYEYKGNKINASALWRVYEKATGADPRNKLGT